ncbi:MAG: carnitine dehydratase [Anaerosolibacter sp.]|jgi:CoA:oxalate CoA-transferase|uniref:CaiB/BaiF CoA transferase family protein n=1 Tax=Anaerosolibacter sp. TaxID=1872527 RepID=UPI002627BB0D|nr:CaiB/BaiF CoA-transferase family protein [Anaerosolibacter sp.]MDF2547618.1 carnitine dehydratase [Anaerosolibacter sp.]
MKQALEGIKVLDLTRVLAGPYATMVMADMGADVIKIEAPEVGDDSRQFGPYIKDESAYFMSLNRNKRSITLNLKAPKAKELFIEMVKKADVVVENYRPGTMEKLGLGYEDLKKINPKIIYAAASGFGHSGPYSKRAAYDAVVQAMGGIMSITGPVGGKPTRVGPSIGDVTAGLFTTIGILSALNYRNNTGVGQKVDVAMLDCQVAILENAIARYVVTGTPPKPAGNRHSSITPFEPFETSDGEIMIAAGNDALFVKMCELFGTEEWVQDERFKTNPQRTKHVEELVPLITAVTKTKTTKEWQDLLDKAGVPNGPINTIDKVMEDPQVLARDMIVEVDHPVAGHLKMAGVPIKMSETQGTVRTHAPLLGQHTEEILKELLGMSTEEIDALKNENIF